LLSARDGWPPERQDPIPGLSLGEATERSTFWREVSKRHRDEELHPPHTDEHVRLEK
jgi:hypothetical protein